MPGVTSEQPHVLVCGTRTFADWDLLCAKLNLYTADLGKIVIVTGAADGADALAERWAYACGHTVVRFHADWEQHGKAAGPIRNQEMAVFIAAQTDGFAVAFHDGKSRGTADMIARCRKYQIPLKVVRY